MVSSRGNGGRWIAPVLALVVYLAFAGTTSAGADAARGRLMWSTARPDVIVGVVTQERMVALSFDDGPDPRWTPAVLDLLDQYGAKATFFLEGDHVDAHPELAREVARRGHEVANHTYDHAELPELHAEAVIAEVQRANAAFAAAGLPEPTLFRPPKGRFDHEAGIAVRTTGLLTVGWTDGLCIEKWTKADAGMSGMLALVRPGAILLGHDGGKPNRASTVAALPAVLDGLRDQGYRIATVSELLALARRP